MNPDPTPGRSGRQLPEHYLQLIGDAAAPGVLGRPDAALANARRVELGLATTRASGGAVWTARRLEAWRDRAVQWLDARLLASRPAPSGQSEHARAALALADIAVRDTWLVRFARSEPAARAQAADRLAAVAVDAPAEFRPPIGTVLALAQWVSGRPQAAETLDWATDFGAQHYSLAVLADAMITRDVSAAVFLRTLAETVTEQECRHPRTITADPPALGTQMAERGWGIEVESRHAMPTGDAWTGSLCQFGRPVASVSQHPGERPVIYFPPGSHAELDWQSDLSGVGAQAGPAVTGLERLDPSRPQPATADDPLLAGTRAPASPHPDGPAR